MSYPRILAGLLLTGSMAMGAYALAQGVAPAAIPAGGQNIQADTMGLPALMDRLAAQGYRDARSIERKGDKMVEVKATGPDGQRHELYVDARTGEILKVERD